MKPAKKQTPLITEVRHLQTSAEIESVVRLFERVAVEEAWKPGRELRAHVDQSVYFGLTVSAEGSQALIGGLQLIPPGTEGAIPSQSVWPELSIANPKNAIHITVLAIDTDWRGKAGGLFWVLTAAMWHYCVRSGIRDLYLEATPRTLRCYRRFGWPIQIIGPLRENWGEACYPCYLSVREVAGALAERAVCSDAYLHILSNMVGMGREDRYGSTERFDSAPATTTA